MFKIQKNHINTWLDKLSFFHIFFIWAGVVTLFGVFYYAFTDGSTSLLFTPTNTAVNTIVDHVYFSFITATSTGFGDIVPLGFFKIISIFEIIFGILLLAFVTSKLISIKQNAILNEIYEISFNERIVRLRSSLLLFRQNLSRYISKIDEGSTMQREIADLHIFIHSLEDALRQMIIFITNKKKRQFTISIDQVNLELLFNSLLQSFTKLNDLMTSFDEKKMDWRKEKTLKIIVECVRLNNYLFERIDKIKNLPQESKEDLLLQNKEVMKGIEDRLKG